MDPSAGMRGMQAGRQKIHLHKKKKKRGLNYVLTAEHRCTSFQIFQFKIKDLHLFSVSRDYQEYMSI